MNKTAFTAVLGPGIMKHFSAAYSTVTPLVLYVGVYVESEMKPQNTTKDIPLQDLKNLWDLRFGSTLATDEAMLQAGQFYMDAANRFHNAGLLYKKVQKDMFSDKTTYYYVVADPRDKNPEIA